MLSSLINRKPTLNLAVGRSCCQGATAVNELAAAKEGPAAADAERKKTYYRLTHCGFKELDDIMESMVRSADFAASKRADNSASFVNELYESLRYISQLDPYDLWNHLFNRKPNNNCLCGSQALA